MGKPQRQSGSRPRLPRTLDILYEDDAVVALDKPAGLPAVPVPGSNAPSAFSLLSAALKARRQRAVVVHRIDRFTSGILLFAKSERDKDALVRQFLAHTPVRQYLALVRGRMSSKEGTLIHYFRKEGMFQKLSRENDSNAARAELRFSVERSFPGASLVRVTLVTGLQNQIRVQFSAISHPVIGDRKYHPAEAEERRIARVALHASHLELPPSHGAAYLGGLRPSCGFPIASAGTVAARSTEAIVTGVRMDKWLWAARFFKTRSIAAHACELGRIESNGQTAKPAREVKIGDLLRVKNDSGDSRSRFCCSARCAARPRWRKRSTARRKPAARRG